jgi:phage terminase large subunit-like protein
MVRLSGEEYRDKQWRQVEEYIEGVSSGKIIASKYIKKAVARFRKDTIREDLEFKTFAVNKVFEFFSIINAETFGELGQFNLLPWQSFILAAIFGFYRAGTNKRKVEEVFIYCARKNGKTTWVAAIQLYFLLMDGDISPESILIAHSRDQANRALNALQTMILHTPALSEILRFNRRQVYVADGTSIGFCETVPAKEASLQGYKLNSCILDEIHTYSDQSLYSAAIKSMASKHRRMLFMISTAGDESLTFCKDRIEYSKQVLDGKVDDDQLFSMLYMLDDEDLGQWNKEELWYKANPSLGPVKDLEFMQRELKKAKFSPASRYDFLTYDLNVYTDSVTKWIMDEYLLPVLSPIDREKLKGRECYIGADFSEVKDLTSMAYLFPDEDGETFDAIIQYFIPKNIDKHKRKGNIDLKYWIEDGYITECPKPIIDDEIILDAIKEANDLYDIGGFGYDKRVAVKLAESTKQIISSTIVKPIQQGYGLSAAIKSVQALIETGKIRIDNNPVTKWNFDNVLIGHDEYSNWRFDKKKSVETIDGVVALTNAYKIWEVIKYGGSGFLNDILNMTEKKEDI